MWDYSELHFDEHVPTWRRRPFVQPGERPLPQMDLEAIRTQQRGLPGALAAYWDDRNVTIICPFCNLTHRHCNSPFKRHEDGSFLQDSRGRYTYDGSSTERYNSRVAHCHRSDISRMDYVIIFPFENDNRAKKLSFELEQTFDEKGLLVKEQFCTVGLAGMPRQCTENQPSDEENDIYDLEQQMVSTIINDGDYDVVTNLYSNREIVYRASALVMAAACSGDHQHLKKLMDGSSNAQALLRIKDEKGVSLLGLAVPNGHRVVVEYLLDEGSDPNVVDKIGRTPLMEAALWGHAGLVDLLLRHGADKHRKDKYGMVAGRFTEDSDQNQQERHTRSLNYSEDPFVKKKDRILIRTLLGYSLEYPSPPALHARDLVGAYFHKSPTAGTISLVLSNRQGIKILQQQKTAAILVRGEPFPLVAAVSGRTGVDLGPFRASEAGFERLNEGYWGGAENFSVAQDIGFDFEEHGCDKVDRLGSFNASHAEAQLMCFFVRRNYLFRNLKEGPVNDDFLQLFLLQQRNQQANIIISKAPCTSCSMLKDRIRAVLGINFTFKTLPVTS